MQYIIVFCSCLRVEPSVICLTKRIVSRTTSVLAATLRSTVYCSCKARVMRQANTVNNIFGLTSTKSSGKA